MRRKSPFQISDFRFQISNCNPRPRRPRAGGAMKRPLRQRRTHPAPAGPVPAERWLTTAPAPPASSGHSFALIVIAALVVAFVAALPASAEDAPPPEQKAREIYVPFSDLHILLESQPKRVMLGRQEYNDLVKRAQRAPETHAPLPAFVATADYSVTAEPQRAEIHGLLSLHVLEDGLHALPLDFVGVGIQSARLDDRDAADRPRRDGPAGVVCRGRRRAPPGAGNGGAAGNHRRPAGAQFPPAPPGRRQPAVDGPRRRSSCKSGADVISRTVDKAARQTRFEILPREGDTSLVMTLNSHLQRQDRVVVARSVLTDEVAEAGERLHAAVTLEILRRPVDRFQFAVPDGFEVTEVSSPLLAQWEVRTAGGHRVLDARLREPTTDTVEFHIAACRWLNQSDPAASLADWTAPRLEPLDVAGSVTVFRLALEDRLHSERIAAEGLIPIDVQLPGPAYGTPTGDSSTPGRLVAAWYAPQAQYALQARFVKPPAEMAVTGSLLLVVSDQGQEMLGGLSIEPQAEKRFSFDLSVPKRLASHGSQGRRRGPLKFEQQSRPLRSRASCPWPPIVAGQDARVRMPFASSSPPAWRSGSRFGPTSAPCGRRRTGWPTGTRSGSSFPAFAVLGARRSQQAIAVAARDDLAVRPEQVRASDRLERGGKAEVRLRRRAGGTYLPLRIARLRGQAGGPSGPARG